MNIFHLTTQEVLERVSRHCPEALSVYLQCINRADENRSVFFSRQMIDVDMSEDWHKFRRAIKALARENLLTWSPLDEGLAVEIVEVADDDDV